MEKKIDGTAIAKQIEAEVKTKIDTAGITPKLAMIEVGNPQDKYIELATNAGKEVGVTVNAYRFPETATEKQVLDKIKELNDDTSYNSILLLHPTVFTGPGSDEQKYLKLARSIKPVKDIEAVTLHNVGRLVQGDSSVTVNKCEAMMAAIKSTSVSLADKQAVVLGTTGNIMLTSTPIAAYFKREGAVATVYDLPDGQSVAGLESVTSQGDVLVVDIQKANAITADFVKQGAVVIDFGQNQEKEGLQGDVDFANVLQKVGFITPVPGGVGPITVAMLMESTYECAVA